ncbi:DUF481 domain-containing protein [Pseudomonas sp. NA-150]|uniref:DUF481 domain-containing protein n=1 Tax=Pseudomonas sp. NA-150 TaxID=3367525 RepID=UPI0037C81A8A
MLSRSLLCLALTSVSMPLLADTVWLKNGDRLTGKITVFDGGKLLLHTDYAGDINVDWKQVKTLESDQKLLVTQDKHNEIAKALKPAEDGKVILANGEPPKTVDLSSIQLIMSPKPLITDFVWKGNVDLALDFQRAQNNTDDYNIAFKTTARHGDWRHNAKGEYSRETTDNSTVNTNNWSAEYSADRFLTDKWFWEGRLTYKRDYVEDLARQRVVGTGPGYQFWDDQLGAFSLGSLINRTDYEFSNGSKQNFYSAALKWDYNRFLIGKKVEFFTNGELGKPLSGAADYSLDSEVGLRYKVTDWASLNLKAEKNIISGASDGDLNKTRYTAGFGVAW